MKAAAAYREALYRAFSGTDRDVDAMVSRALDVGTDYLGVPIGFLTRIRDGTQESRQSTGDHELLQPGETCPLDDAYCRRTVETTAASLVALSEHARELETYARQERDPQRHDPVALLDRVASSARAVPRRHGRGDRGDRSGRVRRAGVRARAGRTRDERAETHSR